MLSEKLTDRICVQVVKFKRAADFGDVILCQWMSGAQDFEKSCCIHLQQ